VKPTFRALVLTLVFGWSCAVQAEVKITPEERVENRPPGRCGWAAVETLARHHGITALYGLADDNPTSADPEDLEEALVHAAVKYRIQYPGTRSNRILRYAIEKDCGAAVGFRELYPGAGGHIVTLVDFGPKVARVIDSSDKEFRVRTMQRDKFLSWWDGFVLVLEKPKKETKKASNP
jgi:hypothetical protein